MESSFLVRNGGSTLSLVHMAIGFIITLIGSFSFLAQAYGGSKVHIVYLGERQHDDPEFVKASHHQMLESLLGSKEEARKSMVYSYRHGFSGFAATLTDSEAKKISEHPDVIHVIPNRIHKLHTTRTWDYLGLSQGFSDGLLHKTSMGSEAIIGIIDTGVWPESESYNDKRFGPIPKRWRGKCVSGEEFNATVHCNKKLIGAKYYAKGLLNEVGHLDDTSKISDFMSPRDADGHGTHTSSTAGGSFVPNVSYNGLAGGTVRGGAPRARIAIYKACWHLIKCATADIWKAFDDAIHDGVDVLSVSLGIEIPLFIEVDKSAYDIVSFHAVMRGIPVICSAGNEGPNAQTVSNVAPWVVTVGATTLDRSLFTAITLGNNLTLLGEAIHTGPDIDFTGIIFPGDSSDDADANIKGKIVLVFDTSIKNLSDLSSYRQEGGSGLIYARSPDDLIEQCTHDFPCIFIDYEIATKILVYIRSTRSPTVRISRTKTLNGRPATTKVAGFSNRGPNSLSPAILKPDIAAPGVNILAAMSPQNTATDGGYAFLSGTSMATPIISGIVTLPKVLHPNWSPAAIRSAMVTTAWRTDPSGEPIFAVGSSKKLADPFDYGGGLVNPEKAAQPGLVYDMDLDDYVMYLCSVGYNDSSISQLVGKATKCPTPTPSVLDVNLPSITIPDLKDKVTLTRTVTNVGPINSVYKAIVKPPLGVKIIVKPKTLVFNWATKKVTFSMIVSTTHKVNTGYYFGCLTWANRVHIVSIPLSVRTQILKYYN